MADTPQQPETGATAATGGEAQAPKASGGLASYLPLIVVIVLMPVAAWVILMVKSRMDSGSSGEAADEQVEAPAKGKESHGGATAGGAHGKGGKGAASTRSRGRSPEMPVPLTREIVAFQPARAPDPTKPDDVDKIVILDAKGEPKDVAQPDKIVVNVANSNGRAYAVVRLSLKGGSEDLIPLINLNRERLLDVATGTLSSKTLDEIDKPGFRNVLRSELLALFNQALGGNALSDVVITDFVTQQ